MLGTSPRSLPTEEEPQGQSPGVAARHWSAFVRFSAYAIPCVVVWAVYLLAFYPGIMSVDSIGQWKQILTFEFTDGHPYVHTLFLWLVTRVWLSPAAVAAVQALALAAVFAGGMLVLEDLGASRRVRIAITALFALMPLNGLYAVTLWKDIPYSICLLWSTIALMRIAESGGAWLRRPLNLAALVVGLGMAWLFRYNGMLPALAVLGGLFVLSAENRRRIAVGGVLCVAAVLLVNGPFKRALYVKYEPSLEMMMVHTLGAVMSHRDADVTGGEREFLERILPREAWENHYDPYNNCPLIYNPKYPPDHAFVAAHSREFYRIFLRVAARNKGLILRHMVRVSSVVWSIAEPRGSYTYVVEPKVVRNDLGLRTASILPGAGRVIARIHRVLSKPSVNWLAYRPAIWMYAGLVIFCLVLWRRPGKLRVLVFFPMAFNIVGIWLTVPSQDVRYLYPSVLITPLLSGYWRALAGGGPVVPIAMAGDSASRGNAADGSMPE